MYEYKNDSKIVAVNNICNVVVSDLVGRNGCQVVICHIYRYRQYRQCTMYCI